MDQQFLFHIFIISVIYGKPYLLILPKNHNSGEGCLDCSAISFQPLLKRNVNYEILQWSVYE